MSEMNKDIEKILFTAEEIEEAIEKVGKIITEDYRDKNLVVIGILKGSVVFFADAIRKIDLPCECDFMSVSSYGNAAVSSGRVLINKDITTVVEGKDVLILEDIVDTGKTLAYLRDHVFLSRGAKSFEICSLLDKPSGRVAPVDVKYKCFEAPNEFLVGYGLDYAEKYRNLPYIGVLKREVYM